MSRTRSFVNQWIVNPKNHEPSVSLQHPDHILHCAFPLTLDQRPQLFVMLTVLGEPFHVHVHYLAPIAFPKTPAVHASGPGLAILFQAMVKPCLPEETCPVGDIPRSSLHGSTNLTCRLNQEVQRRILGEGALQVQFRGRPLAAGRLPATLPRLTDSRHPRPAGRMAARLNPSLEIGDSRTPARQSAVNCGLPARPLCVGASPRSSCLPPAHSPRRP